MYNCVPLINEYQFNELEHATLDWIHTVTGWDRIMSFFPSSGAPPSSANRLQNYNSATYSHQYGVDWGAGWQAEDPWDEEWYPICAIEN